MTDFRKQWNDTCKAAGLVSIGKDTAAKLLAIVYVLGGERESFTHNAKLMADIDYIQEQYGLKGGLVPSIHLVKKLKHYVREIHENNDEPTEWAIKLMKENYGITL